MGLPAALWVLRRREGEDGSAGKTYDPVVFEGAGDGFMRGGENPTSTAATHAADVKARDWAWVGMKEALAQLSK